MNITTDLALAFQQLTDAACADDTNDGQTRSALASANRSYAALVDGSYLTGEYPTTRESVILHVREKLILGVYCADDAGLQEIYRAIVMLATALDVNLYPDTISEPVQQN